PKAPYSAQSTTHCPYTTLFRSKAGSLPPGLSLDPQTGEISGSPSHAGSYTFTVSVDEANGCRGDRDLTIDVNCPGITIGPAALPKATTKEPYSVQLTTNGTAPY